MARNSRRQIQQYLLRWSERDAGIPCETTPPTPAVLSQLKGLDATSKRLGDLIRHLLAFDAGNHPGIMAVQLNHTILAARDKDASATFLAEMLGLSAPTKWGPFAVVATENEVNLDYMNVDGDIKRQHYAFLVSEAEFDEIFGRIRERKLKFWADPGQTQTGEINHHDGGRGVYFEELNGHLLEVITKPYGSGGWNP